MEHRSWDSPQHDLRCIHRTVAFWCVAHVLEYGRRAYLAIGLSSIVVRDPSVWVNLLVVIAVVVTYIVSLSIQGSEEEPAERDEISCQAVQIALDHQHAKHSPTTF